MKILRHNMKTQGFEKGTLSSKCGDEVFQTTLVKEKCYVRVMLFSVENNLFLNYCSVRVYTVQCKYSGQIGCVGELSFLRKDNVNREHTEKKRLLSKNFPTFMITSALKKIIASVSK